MNFPSKKVLVGCVIIFGVLFIMIAQSPHSPCVNQVDVFKNSMSGIFYPKKVKNATRPPRIKDDLVSCRIGNSEGACTDYFDDLKRFQTEFALVTKRCQENQDEASEIYKLAENAIETIANLAWLNPNPQLEIDQIGWLGPSQVALFCRLRQLYTEGMGIDAFQELEAKVVNKLPANSRVCQNCDGTELAASKLEPAILRQKTIFHVNCGHFL